MWRCWPVYSLRDLELDCLRGVLKRGEEWAGRLADLEVDGGRA